MDKVGSKAILAAAVAAVAIAGYVAIRPLGAAPRAAAVGQKPAAATSEPAGGENDPAVVFAKKGREGLTAAMARYKEAVERSPEAVNGYNDLGEGYFLLGQMAEAEKMLREGLAKAKSVGAGSPVEDIKGAVRVRTNLAHVLEAKGDLAGAQALLEEAVALTPRDAAAHNNLANALFLQGKFDGADKHYDFAAAEQPENPETLCNWGVMLYQANRLTDAEAKFRQAIALKKDGAKYYWWLGKVLRKEGRFGPALKAETQAQTADPKMVEAWLEAASIYVEVKEYREAEKFFRVVLTIDRNNLEALVNLGRLRIATNIPEQRDIPDAVTLFQQAVEITHEKDVNLLTQLADAYALAGNFEEATNTLQKATELAKGMKLSGMDREILLQHAQMYLFLQNKDTPGKGEGSPLSVVGGEEFLPGPASANPYDVPTEISTKVPEARVLVPPK